MTDGARVIVGVSAPLRGEAPRDSAPMIQETSRAQIETRDALVARRNNDDAERARMVDVVQTLTESAGALTADLERARCEIAWLKSRPWWKVALAAWLMRRY